MHPSSHVEHFEFYRDSHCSMPSREYTARVRFDFLSAYSALVAREDSESVGGHVRNDEGIEGKESPEVANRKSSFLAALARIRQGMCHRRK